MNDLSPNLFNALFEFYPREGHTPKENFLSEAFAYVLRTCDEARDAWLTRVLGRSVKSIQCEVTTRQTERDEDGIAVFPDMKISGMRGGQQFEVYSEHKWNSPCDSNQIQRYLKVMQKRDEHCQFVFIGASDYQKRKAEYSDARMKGKTFLWEDVFQTLVSLSIKPEMVIQFLDFMKKNGLSPGEPISIQQMQAFLESSGFLARLHHYAAKLLNDYSWSEIPARYRQKSRVEDRWGRDGLIFDTPDWAPTLTAGFLYSTADHAVSLTAPNEGIDLFLRVEGNPTTNPEPSAVLKALGEKVDPLRQLGARVLLKQDCGNGNLWTLLIAQKSLAALMAGKFKEREHLDAIYDTLNQWLIVLFRDGKLEGGLKTIRP